MTTLGLLVRTSFKSRISHWQKTLNAAVRLVLLAKVYNYYWFTPILLGRCEDEKEVVGVPKLKEVLGVFKTEEENPLLADISVEMLVTLPANPTHFSCVFRWQAWQMNRGASPMHLEWCCLEQTQQNEYSTSLVFSSNRSLPRSPAPSRPKQMLHSGQNWPFFHILKWIEKVCCSNHVDENNFNLIGIPIARNTHGVRIDFPSSASRLEFKNPVNFLAS